MSEPRSDPASTRWRRRLIVGAVVIVSLLVSWYLGAAVIPRWWAQRLGDVIGGRLIFGSFLGVVIGALCSAVPVLVLWTGWVLRSGVRRGLLFVVGAVLVATPNLATLGIVSGDGNAAHAGERILDVDGPGFRGGSLVGVILGLAGSAFVVFLLASRRRNKDRAASLASELEASRAASDADRG